MPVSGWGKLNAFRKLKVMALMNAGSRCMLPTIAFTFKTLIIFPGA